MLLAVAIAHAATTVLFTGDPGEATRAAAAATKSWDLRLVTVEELVPEPRVPGGHTCDASPTNANLRALVSRAESRVAYQQWAEASVDLDRAARDLPCLTEAAEASLASRLFFLAGVVAKSRGDDAAAHDAFVRARLFAPGLAWDDRFPPDLRAPFDTASTDLASRARIPVVAGDAALWIDGRPAEADVLAGTHLVQVLKPALTTTEANASTALVVVTAPALARALADPAQNRLLIDAALADRGDAVVVADGKAWRDGRWVTSPRASMARPALIGAGVTALVAGGAGFALGEATAISVAGETTADDYQYRLGRQDEALGLARGGAVVAGVGAALTVAGLLIPGPVHLSGLGVAVVW